MPETTKVIEVTESRWQEMNICDGYLPGGPGLSAQKVLDITSYCSWVREHNGRLLMRFALSKSHGQLVQFLQLNARGEPSNWGHYIVEDVLYVVRPGTYNKKFLLYHLQGDANFFGIERDTLIKLIVEYRPR